MNIFQSLSLNILPYHYNFRLICLALISKQDYFLIKFNLILFLLF